jgi:hypothetical protein
VFASPFFALGLSRCGVTSNAIVDTLRIRKAVNSGNHVFEIPSNQIPVKLSLLLNNAMSAPPLMDQHDRRQLREGEDTEDAIILRAKNFDDEALDAREDEIRPEEPPGPRGDNRHRQSTAKAININVT